MKFKTIRETARMGILNENLLRQRLKQGKLPGIYAGNKFLVNVQVLLEMLEAESREQMKSLIDR